MKSWLLSVCVACALTIGLAYGQCDESTCTSQCYPLTWERDLCQFYKELTEWRQTAAECGLDIPPLPDTRPGSSSVGGSPDEQWRLASDYWGQLTAIWGEQYSNQMTGPGDNSLPRGPPSSMQSPPTAPPPTTSQTTERVLSETTTERPTPTDYLMPTDDSDDMFSGSGLGSGDDITTQLPTEPITMATPTEMSTQAEPSTDATTTDEPTSTDEPSTAGSLVDNNIRWNAANQVWETVFTNWVESSREGAGLRLPTDVDVSTIIDGFGSDERANRGAWSQLTGHWRNNFNVYRESFGGVCSERV